jgi:hypothetical protein
MNPDSNMSEILEHMEFKLTQFRRGLLTLEQALDVVGESARMLSVKVIEFGRGEKRVTLPVGTAVVIDDIPGCDWSREIGIVTKVEQDEYTVELSGGRHWAVFKDAQVLEIPF